MTQRTAKVQWYAAIQGSSIVARWVEDDGVTHVERVVGAIQRDGSTVLTTDHDREVHVPADGWVEVIDETPPLLVLAALDDGTYITLVRYLQPRKDLDSIQALDAGGGLMTMNLRAAQGNHPLRIKLKGPDAPPIEVLPK